MAAVAISIEQDNSIGGVYLMSIHNPLVFIVKATYTSTAPDVIYAKINSVVYNCIYYSDESATERLFYFIADEILRSNLGHLTDRAQTADTILHIDDLSKDITITFSASATVDTVSDSVVISVVNASNDFESVNGVVMVDEFNNVAKTYITAKDQKVYLYWYNDNAANVVNGTTYPKGFLRRCIAPATVGNQTNSLVIDGVTCTHNLVVKDWCTNDILLKYMDKKGQYRFMPFNSFYTRQSKPEKIGEVNELIISLLTDKSDTRNIGYRNSDTLTLTAVNLSETEVTLLKDLYNSSDIQVYTTKWVRVTIAGDNISRLAKRRTKDVTITVNLPKSYNITEL